MKLPVELKLEELVDHIEKANLVVEETKTSIGVLKQEVLKRLKDMKIDGTKVGEYNLSKAKRLITSDVKMSEAEEYGAIKKSIDSYKLKKLISKGVRIKGIKWSTYLIMRRIEK